MSLREMVELLRRLISGPEGNTHDYTARYWGHDYTFTPIDGGRKGSAMGWGDGLRVGDYIILEHKGSRNGSSRYRIKSVEYYRDPPDMWSADLEFAPR